MLGTFTLDSDVVTFLHAIQVHVEHQIGMRCKVFQPLAQEHAVGAKLNIPAALQDLRAHHADVGQQQRFAAARDDESGPLRRRTKDHRTGG